MTGGSVALPKAPSFRLDGRRALVTGAGRGLGLAFAAGLAEAGAHVVLIARSEGEIERAAHAINAAGGSAEAVLLDVTDVERVRRVFGAQPALDILVNNAGTNRPKPMIEISEADFDLVAGLNLRAAYFVAQAAVSRMISLGTAGSIIHVSSQMGHVGSANRTVYCATKHGLEGLTKAMAVELAPFGIRVNSIAPTFVETDMTRGFLKDAEFKRQVMTKIKLGRMATVEDVLGAALYLASDASKMVTGTSLIVDGGWTAE